MKIGKKQILDATLEQQMIANVEITERLQKTGRQLQSLQTFLNFVNQKTELGSCQLCQLKKLKVADEDAYIAYFLTTVYDPRPYHTYSYDIDAYLSTDTRFPVYCAKLTWQVKEPLSEENCLILNTNYVKSDSLKGLGIGSTGMDIIKKQAKQLQCRRITGLRRVLKTTSSDEEKQKEEEILFHFYKKNGFVQSKTDDKIEYVFTEI